MFPPVWDTDLEETIADVGTVLLQQCYPMPQMLWSSVNVAVRILPESAQMSNLEDGDIWPTSWLRRRHIGIFQFTRKALRFGIAALERKPIVW